MTAFNRPESHTPVIGGRSIFHGVLQMQQ